VNFDDASDRRFTPIFRQFVSDGPPAIDKIRAALAAGDLVTAERGAHTLRGDANTVGASALAESAANAESAIKNGSGIAAALDSLAAELARTVAEISLRLPR